jgi:CRP/FNR family transcriptional regulator, cyclic AMP receptor protein
LQQHFPPAAVILLPERNWIRGTPKLAGGEAVGEDPGSRQRPQPRKQLAWKEDSGKGPFDLTKLFAHTKGVTSFEYGKQRRVFSQGDSATAVFYLRSGRIKVTVVSPQGKEAVIALLEAGDFFGEGCFVGHPKRMTTATTMTSCTLWRIEKDTLSRILHRNRDFSDFFVKHLLTRTNRLEADLVDHLFNSAEKRLARALLLLAHVGEGRKLPVVPRISQETLAEMIGSTRERVSFFMNKFRRLGFLDYNEGLHIYSSLVSVVLNDQPDDHNT